MCLVAFLIYFGGRLIIDTTLLATEVWEQIIWMIYDQVCFLNTGTLFFPYWLRLGDFNDSPECKWVSNLAFMGAPVAVTGVDFVKLLAGVRLAFSLISFLFGFVKVVVWVIF